MAELKSLSARIMEDRSLAAGSTIDHIETMRDMDYELDDVISFIVDYCEWKAAEDDERVDTEDAEMWKKRAQLLRDYINDPAY